MVVAHVATGTVAFDTSGTDNTPAIVSPAGAIDDLLLCFLNHDQHFDGAFSNTDGALSWTAVDDGATFLGDDSLGAVFFAKEDQAAGRTFDWTFDTVEQHSGVIIRYSGQHLTTPIQSGSLLRRDGGAAKDVSIDTLGAMGIYCLFSDATIAWLDLDSAPHGYTQRVNSRETSTCVYIADRVFDEDDYPYASVVPTVAWFGKTVDALFSTSAYWNIHFVLAPAVTDYTLSGATKDKDGNALGSCTVELWKETAGGDIRFIASTTSHASTGAYSFTVPNDTDAKFRTLAYKDDTPHVFDVTDRVLQPT